MHSPRVKDVMFQAICCHMIVLVDALLLFSVANGSGNRNSIYVSRARGNDTASCGSKRSPCCSIPEAIRISQWSYNIFIDSTNTEITPYDCSTVLSSSLRVKKSLSFFGYPGIAHVACHVGLYFMGQNNTELQIEFTKLSFTSTKLKFISSSVKISDCFINDGEGLDFFPDQRRQSLFLESTIFTNNSQCIEIRSSKYAGPKIGFIMVLIIKDSIFNSNWLPSNFSNGVISIYNTSGSTNFSNLTFSGNEGPLLLFDYSKGKFEGDFSNIRVVKNAGGKRTSDGAQRSLLAITARIVHLSFADVLFSSNQGCRCLAIDSTRISISIRGSRFEAHKIDAGDGGVLLFRKSHSLLASIEDTEFLDCQSNKGGALHFSHKNKKINFTARNVFFSRCKASDSGGAILVNGNDADLMFENVTFVECMADGSGGGISMKVENLYLILLLTIWKACNSFYGDALSIAITTGNCTIIIGNSEFDDAQSDPSAFNLHTVYIYATQNNAGSLMVYDTIFLNSPYALWTIDTIFVNLTRVYFRQASIAALSIISNTMQSTARVFVDGCVFENNTGGVSLFVQEAKIVNVTVKNSNFSKFSNSKNGAGGQAIDILAKTVIEINSSISSFVFFENLLVEENLFITLFPDAAVSVNLKDFLAREGNVVEVINSRFIKNQNLETASASDGKAGALLVVMPTDNMTSPGCVTDTLNPKNHRKWNYKNKVVIVNTSFENNIGLTGALYTSNGDTSCINCLFKDNIAISRSGQVHMGENSGRLQLINSTFLETLAGVDFYSQEVEDGNDYQTSTFVSSYSAGALIITGTVFRSDVSKQSSRAIVISKGGELKMTNQSLLLCPTGSKLVMEDFSHFVTTEFHEQSCKISVTVVTLSCQECPGGTYSLQSGNTTSISATAEGFYCFACPYGANCNHNVVAQTNFWGYRMSHNPPQLEFLACPASYCITPNTRDTTVYNGCYGNREGKLCGTCKRGFTEELLSTSCIEKTQCDSLLFWGLLFLFSFLVALYLLLQPTIFRVIYKQIIWLRQRDDQEGFANTGYTKIVFYFYQIAGILLLETYMELIEKTKILSTIISAFSFHITIGSSKTIGCPFVGITPITKVIFTNIGVLTILFCIFIVFLANAIVCKVKGTSTTQVPYLAATLELLLLGYANVAKAILKLLTCVTVGSESVLFLQGNTPCWQWWQVILGILVAFFIVPLIGILFWGSRKSYKKQISPKEMLLALVMPVPYIVRRLYTHFKRRDQSGIIEIEEEERVDWSRFTDVLYGPFRPPTDETKGTLYWESVLVGRRLLLLSIHALVVDPQLRMFFLSLTCVAVFYHHLLMFPFNEAKANHLEAISLLALIVIANINLCKAVLWSAGVTPIGPNLTHIRVLEWIEMVLLAAAPFGFAVLFACFAVSVLLRLVLVLGQGVTTFFSSLKTFILVEEDRPLIAN